MFQECKMISKYLTHPCHILHTLPCSLAVDLDVCYGGYGTGTQKNQSEQQTFLFPYAVISPSRACAVWQHEGCVGCV